jgi:hypothetical protein
MFERPRYSASDGRIWPGPQVGDLIAHIYQKPLAEIRPPDGWEFTGEFGKSAEGDVWLGTDGSVGFHVNNYPRLIIRKKPRLVGYKFTHVRDENPAGEIYPGEWYANRGRTEITMADHRFHPMYTAMVFTREEIFE